MKKVGYSVVILTASLCLAGVSHALSHWNDHGKRECQILQNDVVGYFDLDNTYNTPLKKAQFLSSSDSKQQRDSLGALRRMLLADTFYLQTEETFPIYNVNRRSFVLELNKFPPVNGAVEALNAYLYDIEGVWAPFVPIKVFQSKYGELYKTLEIATTPEDAAGIELQNGTLLTMFQLSGSFKSVNDPTFGNTTKIPKVRWVRFEILIDDKVKLVRKYRQKTEN
jgi:hypothetical protein